MNRVALCHGRKISVHSLKKAINICSYGKFMDTPLTISCTRSGIRSFPDRQKNVPRGLT